MPDFKKLPTVNGTGVALLGHSHVTGGPSTGLALWLDASQITGLADGATVSSWADQSGNSRDATQAISGSRPTYRTGVLNGRPVVRFDGTDDFLATAAFGATLAQPNTVLAVARHTTLAAALHFVFDGSTSNGREAMYRDNTGNVYRLYAAGVPLTGPTADTAWHIRGGIFNGSGSSLLTDGVAVAGTLGGDPLHGATIGAEYSAVTGFLAGDIAELVVYNRALNSEELTYTGNYFASKYGVGFYQPPDSFASHLKWMTD